jgi:hypothetical protein
MHKSYLQTRKHAARKLLIVGVFAVAITFGILGCMRYAAWASQPAAGDSATGAQNDSVGGQAFTPQSAVTENLGFSLNSASPSSGAPAGGNIVTLSGVNLPHVAPSDYVQNGLIAQYDAINNTGTGDTAHSNTTATWKDLVGSHDMTITNPIWNARSFAPAGESLAVSSDFGGGLHTNLTVEYTTSYHTQARNSYVGGIYDYTAAESDWTTAFGIQMGSTGFDPGSRWSSGGVWNAD